MTKLVDGFIEIIRSILIGFIEYCLETMFTDINDGMKYAIAFAGSGVAKIMPEVFEMIKALSENVLLPICAIIISFILTYELISMVMDRNNMHEFDSGFFIKYLFKAAVAVFLLSKSYDIAMAVFDVGDYIVTEAGKVILAETDLSISADTLTIYKNNLSVMPLGELAASAEYIIFDTLIFKILAVLIAVLSYGRVVEIFLMISIAPVAFSTLGNKEWGQIGINYIKALVALAFQGFFIMVIVAIYSALVAGLKETDNFMVMIFNLMIMGVLFCFALFKTSSFSKQIFNVR